MTRTWVHRGRALWLATLASSALLAQDQAGVDAVSAQPLADVLIDGIPLFKVAGSASFPSAQRAHDVAARISDAAHDESVRLEDIHPQPNGDRIDILAGTRHLVTTVDSDARIDGLSLTDAAQFRSLKIKEAVTRYRAERTPAFLLRAAGYSAAALIISLLALFLVVKAVRRARAAVEERYRSRVRSLTISSFELVRADTLWRVVRTFITAIGVVLCAVIIYVTSAYSLRQFPWTRSLADHLVELVTQPASQIGMAFLSYLPNLVVLLLIWLITRYALKLTQVFTSAVSSGAVPLKGFDAEWARPTYQLIRVGIVLLALVIAYPYLPGSGSAAFQGLSIFAGLMLSLGASSAMASVIAGYAVTFRRAFHVGDRVAIGDLVGEVREVRLLVTHLRTAKNEEIVVPNSMVLSSHVVNYSKFAADQGLILHTSIRIGYSTPWRQVEALLLQAAGRTPGLLATPVPFVLEKSLDEFSISYELNVYVGTTKHLPLTYATIHRNILDVFNEYGIQIMVPAYEGDPQQPKVVSRDLWFSAPAASPSAEIAAKDVSRQYPDAEVRT